LALVNGVHELARATTSSTFSGSLLVVGGVLMVLGGGLTLVGLLRKKPSE